MPISSFIPLTNSLQDHISEPAGSTMEPKDTWDVSLLSAFGRLKWKGGCNHDSPVTLHLGWLGDALGKLENTKYWQCFAGVGRSLSLADSRKLEHGPLVIGLISGKQRKLSRCTCSHPAFSEELSQWLTCYKILAGWNILTAWLRHWSVLSAHLGGK